MRAANLFLAFASATAVWLICVTASILLAIVVGIVPIILMVIWDAVAPAPVGDTTFDAIAVMTILLVTLALMPSVSTVILRLSLRLSPLPVGHTANSRPAATLWLSWLLVMAALLVSGSEWITLVVAILIGAIGIGRAHYFRRQWSGFPRSPTVLFLRRFGRTADRLVSTAIRRAMPERTSLAFLVGSRQGAASWDPLVVGFDGMNRRALPYYLRSTDDDWIDHVKQMVLRADAVVLDATDWSEAMDTELDIVDACRASERLVILIRPHDTADQGLLGRQRLLRYRASWRQAGHRIFWGFMLALLPAVIADSAGWSVAARVVVSVPAVAAWLCLAVRPLMDARSTEELARTLTALHDSRSAVRGNGVQPPVSEPTS